LPIFIPVNTPRSIVCLLFFFVITGCGQENDRVKPRRGPITESVYATVVVLPEELYRAHASVGGIAEKIMVKEGDTVLTGAPIMHITNTAPELNVRNARLALQLAEEEYTGKAAVLERIKDDIEVARLTMQQDSVDFMRQKRLRENNIGTEAEYDRRKLAYEVSKKTLARLEDELIRTRIQLETKLEQARNTYETTLTNAQDYTVTSKIDGKVYGLYKEVGEFVNFQEPVAAIGSSSKFIIEMLVDEVDIARVFPDQQVIITLDAFEDQAFRARITRILPQKDERTQTFTIEAKFEESPPSLYAGLSGEANIIIRRKDNVLLIPREYLMDQDKVRTEEGVIGVTTGLMSMEEVEILSGLDTTTYLYRPQ